MRYVNSALSKCKGFLAFYRNDGKHIIYFTRYYTDSILKDIEIRSLPGRKPNIHKARYYIKCKESFKNKVLDHIEAMDSGTLTTKQTTEFYKLINNA